MYNRVRKGVLLLLCAAMVAAAMPQGSGVGVQQSYADDKSDQLADLNNQYDELEQQQKEIQAQIDQAKNEKDKYLAQKNQLDGQINNTQQQINVLTNRIDLLNSMIAENERKIAELEGIIDKNYEVFRQRVRASYMARDSSTINLLLGAD